MSARASATDFPCFLWRCCLTFDIRPGGYLQGLAGLPTGSPEQGHVKIPLRWR